MGHKLVQGLPFSRPHYSCRVGPARPPKAAQGSLSHGLSSTPGRRTSAPSLRRGVFAFRATESKGGSPLVEGDRPPTETCYFLPLREHSSPPPSLRTRQPALKLGSMVRMDPMHLPPQPQVSSCCGRATGCRHGCEYTFFSHPWTALQSSKNLNFQHTLVTASFEHGDPQFSLRSPAPALPRC
jgi:hypothetical protein